MALLVTSCKKKSAPEFDNSRSTSLLDALEAMEKNQDEKAARILRQLQVQNGDFTEEMMLVLQNRKQMKVVDDFLAKGDFESLRIYLEEKQRSGEASPELLAMKDLPNDLEALAIFCSKMPWEDSKSLQNALDKLQDSVANLSKYETFRNFYQEQLQTLKALQKKEYQERTRDSLEALDEAVATRKTEKIRQAAARFAKDSGTAEWKKALSLAKNGTPGQLANPALFAIAVANVWNELTLERKYVCSQALQAAGRPANLCWELVEAWSKDSLEQWEKILRLYHERKLMPPPEVAVATARALKRRNFHPVSSVVTPGYTDLLSGLLQLETITTQEKP